MESKTTYYFGQAQTDIYFQADKSLLSTLNPGQNIILVTDENIHAAYADFFASYKSVIIKAGEINKQQAAVDSIISQLLEMGADKSTYLIGVGGGVVTDITGFAASIYKRGMKLALMPTSILAMVDAALGGKNGVDAGLYKNMIGTIYQPGFILFDYDFLKTLPRTEWINGFAEIIKHAAIKDAGMFSFLEENDLETFMQEPQKISGLIEKNARLKLDVVTRDEKEIGERKMLNFGHTLGHAIENLHHLPHGHAISIGMVAAAQLSEKILGYPAEETARLIRLLKKYHLPVECNINVPQVFKLLAADKKVTANQVDFILLKKTGQAEVHSLPLQSLENYLNEMYS
ncbi:MAG: 3-dehydroquinate synthase [Ferruginibacter sp.]